MLRLQGMRRAFLLAAVAIGWAALILQAVLTMRLTSVNGMTGGEGLARYLSYFTVLTNIVAAVALLVTLLRWPRQSPKPNVMTAIAVYIAIVGAVYSLVLRQLWEPTGLQKLADIALHDAMPLIFIIYWLIYVPKADLRWSDPVRWLIYPVLYFAITLVRGTDINWYPYPFIDVAALGLSRVLLNAAGLFAVFFVTGLIAVAAGRALGRYDSLGTLRADQQR